MPNGKQGWLCSWSLNKSWKSIIVGWTHREDKYDKGESQPNPEINWTEVEDEAAFGNFHALNVIFNGVDKKIFHLINICTSAKEALNILAIAHEVTLKVKMFRLQLLAIKFENLKMQENHCWVQCEAFWHYQWVVCLGEKIPEEKLVRKILKSLPKTFDMKDTAIGEAHDISSMKVNDLFGSFLMFEMSLNDKFEKKSKGVALPSSTEECVSDHVELKWEFALPS